MPWVMTRRSLPSAPSRKLISLNRRLALITHAECLILAAAQDDTPSNSPDEATQSLVLTYPLLFCAALDRRRFRPECQSLSCNKMRESYPIPQNLMSPC